MAAKSMLNRALETRKEKKYVFAISPGGLDGGKQGSFVFQADRRL